VARRFGLAIDNLLGVEIVTADARILRANAGENPDLYWGVRGGGGNFGIVTGFEFRLHPMQREVVGGRLVFPLERARDLLELFAGYGATAPDDLYFDPFMVLPPAGERGVVGLSVCYSGPASRADQALAPLRALGTPAADELKPMDYAALQRSGDITDPRAMGLYVKGGFIPSLPADLITAMVDGFAGHPARATQLFFQHCGGAIGRVAPAATAFPHRSAHANMLTAVAWRMGDDPAEHVRWIKEYWTRLEPFTRGFYVNDADPNATAEDVNGNYLGNHARLVSVKNTYDPTNLFRLNANVKPTG
jgi:FAD/FMN-containing dehydrogenase